MSDEKNKPEKKDSVVSRRSYLKASGISLGVPLVVGHRVIKVNGQEVKLYGPVKTSISLLVNGATKTVEVEPRVTLLEALRHELDMTGAKRVCDRATCGACTMIVDGKAVYSCTVLAIEAEGHAVTTIEGLAPEGHLHPLMSAFVDNDAQQCGFCTPGFVVAAKAFLDKH